MKKFFYQLKVLNPTQYDKNNWDIVFCDIEESESKKELIEKIKFDLNTRKIKEKTSSKSTEALDYKIFATELNEYWEKHWLSIHECKVCKNKYTFLSSKQNDDYCNSEVCSVTCLHLNRKEKNEDVDGYFLSYINKEVKPCIYKITNKNTNMVYIGQTQRVFTLRWYEHFFNKAETKFHEAISNSKPNDWIFEVIEIIDIPETTNYLEKRKETKKLLDEREMYWIKQFNSLDNGYNSFKLKEKE